MQIFEQEFAELGGISVMGTGRHEVMAKVSDIIRRKGRSQKAACYTGAMDEGNEERRKSGRNEERRPCGRLSGFA